MSVIDAACELYQTASIHRNEVVEFEQWFNTTVLNCWIINKRLLAEGDEGRDLSAEFVRHIWLDVDIKLVQAGISPLM